MVEAALGRPVAFHLTVGEAADCKAYDALISLPDAPRRFAGRQGLDADAIRADLAGRKSRLSFRAVQTAASKLSMTGRSTSRATASSKCSAISKSTESSSPATTSLLGMVQIAAARYWLKFVHAAWEKGGGSFPEIISAVKPSRYIAFDHMISYSR